MNLRQKVPLLYDIVSGILALDCGLILITRRRQFIDKSQAISLPAATLTIQL
jgi:hypothetical protein